MGSLIWKIIFLPLRAFFYLLYHQFAWTYDWVADLVSAGLWETWVLATLPYLKGPDLLELGHGPGHLQISLLKKTGKAAQMKRIIGLDSSPQMSRLASKRLRGEGLTPSLVNARAQCMPFNSGCFQQVVATFPTNYIVDADALAEIWRLLTPGGEMLILPLAQITGRRWRERACAWLFRFTKQTPEWDEAFLRPFKRAGFKSELEWVELKSSTLLLIHARKPVDN